MTEKAPEKVSTPTPVQSSRLSKIKTAFLYVLIAGLAAAALTSVIALLFGEFTSSIAKTLLTITVLFTHSILILAVLWADRLNQVGRLILPTAIVILLFANIITSTLGIWEIISAEFAWRAIALYFLLAGAVYVVVGLLRLRVAHQLTLVLLYTAIALIAASVLSLSPWVLHVFDRLDPLYFRIVGALAILSSTTFLITMVIRGIAMSKNDSLKLTAPKQESIPGGLLAVYIVVGTLTAMVWCGGMTAFLVSAVESAQPSTRYENSRSRYY